jgi:O-antigen/teichoic acid export membrane protein
VKRSSGDQRTLSGLASRALGWSFFNNALARLGTLGIGILLARLLGPHAFGAFAVALVALLALLSFNELGVSLAIVRWEGAPGEIAPTVATISVLSSIVIYIGCFLGAPAFANAMGAPSAASVIRVLALNIVVDGVVATPAALMQRYFRQDRKMIADQVNNWLGAAVSVFLAWKGMGAMSLAIGRMTGAVAAGVLFVVFSPEPLRFGFDRARARALFHFGLPLAGASIVVFAVTNVDQLVVGRVLGATALGFYALAFNLASWPVNMFSVPVRSVAPAVFSRLQHDPPAMRTGFLSTAGLLGSATLPICLLISGIAIPLLRFVYGARWVPASKALIWLALLAALRILFELVYDYFVVLARSRVVFTVQLVWLIALVPALIAGTLTDGIAGAAIAEVAVAALLVIPWYLRELSKVGIQRRALAGRLWLPVVAAVAVGAAAAGAARVIPNDFAACAVGGVLALMAAALLIYRMRPALAMLRPALGRQEGLQPGSASDQAAAGRPGSADPDLALLDPGASRPADPAVQAAALRALLAMAVPAPALSFRDLTGPLPMYRDFTGAMPVYQEVVASVRWDPAAARRRIRGEGKVAVPERELARAWAAESAKYARARRQAAPGPAPGTASGPVSGPAPGPAPRPASGPAPRPASGPAAAQPGTDWQVPAAVDPGDANGASTHQRRGQHERS